MVGFKCVLIIYLQENSQDAILALYYFMLWSTTLLAISNYSTTNDMEICCRSEDVVLTQHNLAKMTKWVD